MRASGQDLGVGVAEGREVVRPGRRQQRRAAIALVSHFLGSYLTESVYKVVMKKSIPAQIRQRIANPNIKLTIVGGG